MTEDVFDDDPDEPDVLDEGEAIAGELRRFDVGVGHAGARLDRVVADLSGLSRTRVKALIEAGRVQLGGALAADPSRKVQAGDGIGLELPPLEPAEPAAEDIPLRIVYEDDDLIVIDKPVGLVVHPAPGNSSGTLVNALLHHCRGQLSGIGGVARPGIVHRLDKDTSGLLVAAKTDRAHQGLARMFHDHDLERGYMAVVWGRPRLPSGTVAAAIGRSPQNRKKMAVVKHGGRHAVTHWRLIRPIGSRASLIDCRLETGRTHQIRVHLAHIGHPVVGDPLYGGLIGNRMDSAPAELREAAKSFQTQALHAYLLGFRHPTSDERCRFEAELSTYINVLLGILEKL